MKHGTFVRVLGLMAVAASGCAGGAPPNVPTRGPFEGVIDREVVDRGTVSGSRCFYGPGRRRCDIPTAGGTTSAVGMSAALRVSCFSLNRQPWVVMPWADLDLVVGGALATSPKAASTFATAMQDMSSLRDTGRKEEIAGVPCNVYEGHSTLLGGVLSACFSELVDTAAVSLSPVTMLGGRLELSTTSANGTYDYRSRATRVAPLPPGDVFAGLCDANAVPVLAR